MIIHVGHLWSSITGITIFPFIFILKKMKYDTVLINHERIHLRQQLECLIILFYVIYVAHYLINLMIYKDRNKAYRNIIFEKECYSNQSNSDYLKKRKLFNWLRYG